jgi:hypothetical protein
MKRSATPGRPLNVSKPRGSVAVESYSVKQGFSLTFRELVGSPRGYDLGPADQDRVCLSGVWKRLVNFAGGDVMSHVSIRPCVGALAILGLLLVTQRALPLAAAAQQPLPGARTGVLLGGVVVDESTGQPVEAATVLLVGTDIEAETGRFGGFAFPDAPLGTVSVRVTAPGHPSVVQAVDVRSDRIVFLQVIVPSFAALLSELLVSVRGNESVARRVTEAAQLTAADLLAIKVPSARGITGDIGKNGFQIRLRGYGSFTQDLQPLVIIDGVRVSGTDETAFDVLSQIPASVVEDIQVLRGASAAFLYPLAANGVVRVRTKR